MVVKALAAGAIGLALGVAASGSILADPPFGAVTIGAWRVAAKAGSLERRSLHPRRAGPQRRNSAGARRGPETRRARRQRRPSARSPLRLSRRHAHAGGALLDAEPHRRRRLSRSKTPPGATASAPARSCATATAASRSTVSALAHAGNWLPIGRCPDLRAGAAPLRYAAGRQRRRHRQVERADDRAGKLRMSVIGARLGGAALFVAAVAATAALVHFAIVLLVPVVATHDAYARLAELGPPGTTARAAARRARRATLSLGRSGARRRVVPLRSVGRAGAGQGAGRPRRLRLARRSTRGAARCSTR